MNLRHVVPLFVLLLAACATQPVAPAGPLPFDQAVQRATDDLIAQSQRMPAFLVQRVIVHDPTLDAESGQQTEATSRLDSAATARLRERFELLPFRSASLAKADYLLASTMTREDVAVWTEAIPGKKPPVPNEIGLQPRSSGGWLLSKSE